MRDFCLVPSRDQCIRYVVSYPRLSRMTRRNGTYAYLRFCARAPDALFLPADRAALDAGLRTATRRAAGLAVFFAAVFRLAAGAATRARVRAGPLTLGRGGAAGLGAAAIVAGRAAFTSGTAVRWTMVNRG